MVAVESAPISEFHITLTPREAETPLELVFRLARALRKCDATIVRAIVYGPVAAHQPVQTAWRQALGQTMFPITWVEGAGCVSGELAGIQVHAVAGATVRTETTAGAVACIWDDELATHCVLNGLGPTRFAQTPQLQSAETLENLRLALRHAGMTIKNVARTWFFLEDILSWYSEFNRVRNDFFSHCELRSGSVPASTGVGGRNPAGAALMAAARAINPHDHSAGLLQVVPSPLQGPAPAYGSAFSRAVEIRSAGFRQLLVSGTASIAPCGRTEHIGDAHGQIELSMRVVAAILESRQMTFADVSRATAYFKSPADVAAWDDWRARHEQRTMPVVCACCDICRDNLLFEIELDAVRADV